MDFYTHHLNDYAQETMHLDFVEDAAYSRLLRMYYATESPLPKDVNVVQSLVEARTRAEKKAVKTVLSEFFSLADDGWHHARCDADIAALSGLRAGEGEVE